MTTLESEKPKIIKSRGRLPIYYSTTSGMSKALAFDLQGKLEETDFVAPVFNVGDIDPEEFLQYQGPVIMLLSTYGNGDSPQDGEQFLNFVLKMKNDTKLLKKLSFAVLALGNSTFENFCGHGRKVTQAFLEQGAKMIHETTRCDANSQTNNSKIVYEKWYPKVIESFKTLFQIRDIPIDELASGFSIEITKRKINWEQECQKITNLSKEFDSYNKSPKAEVIHIKEMRTDTEKTGRSTYWIRVKKPEQLVLTPACNVNVYPENIISQSKEEEDQVIEFKSNKKTAKIPFPPMPISQLKRIVNLRQKPSNKLLKNAIMLSKQSEQIKLKYSQLVNKNDFEGITCQKVLDDLKPSYEFFSDLGVNLARPYTLSSWDEKEEYFDLCVSLVPDGLTSQYFKTKPKYLRINSYESTFVPPQKPLFMIANGSGIAPFRSILEFVAQQPKQKRIPLTLYYGIQNENVDYYFKQDFQKYEQQGIVQIKIAESRKDPQKKVYIQQLLEEDKQKLHQHLFKNEGRVYICGGKEMAKSINSVIFKAIVLECKVPYKGFTISKEFKNKGIVVQEVFG